MKRAKILAQNEIKLDQIEEDINNPRGISPMSKA
jgi:hypothetical protein